MRKKIKEYMEKYHMTAPGDLVITGVSGGADSVCLLLMLSDLREELGIALAAVHVNHQIRSEAQADEDYVRALCGRLSVPFYGYREDVETWAKEKGLGVEEAGRILRYQVFSQTGELYGHGRRVRIAVAHHQDDRAETVLFHLFRGSGTAGLAGIRPVRENIIRPLLCMRRIEIEEYLFQKGISYCTDHTNETDHYARNRIRHHILPYAEQEICRNSTEHIVRAAEVLDETEQFLAQLTEERWNAIVKKDADTEGFRINLAVFSEEKELIRKRLLLKTIEKLWNHRKDITSRHIDNLLMLLNHEGSQDMDLPGDLAVSREYGSCLIYKKSSEKRGKCEELAIKIPGVYEVEPGMTFILEKKIREKGETVFKEIIPQKTYTKWFDYDKIEKSLRVRTRRPGDYIMINGGKDRKTLKKYMIEEKIPKSRRDHIYLLAEGQHILWIVGYRISEYYKIGQSTEAVLKVQWISEEENTEERSHENG